MKEQVRRIKVFKQQYSLFEDTQVGDKKAYCEQETLFDEHQNVIEETKYLEDGSVDEVARYTYDSKHRLKEEIIDSSLSEGEDRRVIEYDDANHVITETNFYGDEPGEQTISKRNSDDDIIEIRHFDEEGQLMSVTQISYFKKGLTLKEEETDMDGKVIRRVSNVYNESGQLTAQEVLNMEEEPNEIFIEISREMQTEVTVAKTKEGDIHYRHTRIFDAEGQLESLEVDGPDHHYKVTYKYTPGGQPSLQEITDPSGNLIRRSEYTFDDNNRLVEELLVDNQTYLRENTHFKSRYEYEFF